MNRFLLQLAYLPVTLFMASVDLYSRLVDGTPLPAGARQPSLGTIPPPMAASGSGGESDLSEKENLMSDDRDLSGGDVKLVTYSILFTKRDLESTLQADQEQLVNYDTDGASFGALKLAEFTAKNRFPLPQVWKDSSYPHLWPEATNTPPLLTVADIPDGDRKYIRFIYRVKERLTKTNTEYDERQTKALEGIENALKGR